MIQVEIPFSLLVDQLNIPFEVIARISNLNDQMQLKLAIARLGRHSKHTPYFLSSCLPKN